MNLCKTLVGLLMALGLVACGGGGGSPGTVVTGGATTTAPDATAGSLTLALVRTDGTVVTAKNLSQTEDLFLEAVVNDSAGNLVDGLRVTFSLDSSEAVLIPSSGVALSSNGRARVQIAPASVSSQGVVGASVAATINGEALSQSIDMSISPGVVTLSNLVLTPDTLQKGQSLVASVNVSVNGAPAPSNAVNIGFSSTCGVATPATATVDTNAEATTVIQTDKDGACSVTASYGGNSLQKSYTVTAPPTTGVEFVSVSPEKIYQAGSTGATTSIVKFKVINSVGAPVPTVPITATLTNTDGGVNFCGSPYQSLPANSVGEVEFSVCSGTLPTTVQVKASLDTDPKVFTLSNLLTVQTGAPTQRFFDISATQLNYYVGGWFTSGFNGNEVEISVYAADRQGNPVPEGTPIVFVSEGGQLVTSGMSSCLIGSNGRCSVKLVGQEYRPLGSSVGDPRPGRVTVLAFADGEESFIDSNNNNRFDTGEQFEDLGLTFIDKDEDDIRTVAYTNLVVGTNEGESTYPLPPGASGASACPANVAVGLSAQNTCNNQWDGATKVRRSIVIVFSGGEIGQPSNYHATIPADKRTSVLQSTRGGALVRLADLDGNPLPATAALSTEVLGGGSCAAKLIGTTVGNSIEPTLHQILFDQCSGGEQVLLKARIQDKESFLSISVP